MNILNLPDWEVIELKESEYDYAIHAKYTPELTAKKYGSGLEVGLV